ncbi:MAG: Flp pilus assembly complex ATPase component TadA [Desulfuromonadales bacterium]|nr:Flp pilus assembly complex ATPase component TadA [Desulfuromonadales bacterium]
MSDARKLGEILIEDRLITSDQLAQALEAQKLAPHQPLGRILVKLGHLSETDLRAVLDRTGKWMPLEEVLRRHEFIAPEDLDVALEMSRLEQLPLGQVLLNLANIDSVTLAKAISYQYDLPFVRLNKHFLEPGLAEIINLAYAQRHKVAPIEKSGNTLTLAVATPPSGDDLRDLAASLQLRIAMVVAPEEEIAAAQATLYKLEVKEKTISFKELIAGTEAEDIEPDDESEARRATEKDSVLVQLVNKIICDAHASGASDIHIEPYPGKNDIEVRFRIDGCCELYQQLPYRYKYAIPSRIKIMADMDIAERRKPQDGKINFKKFGPIDVELRVASMPTVGGMEDVVMRLLNVGGPIALENLNLSERNKTLFEAALAKPYGLVLVVGPTGSGKTTTLHAGIARINTPKLKVWTAEDPVEITQKGLRQVQVHPKIGFTFATALRSFLRLDPDVIMVGEMRDMETASIAIEASLTGHLVLSTLHTSSAPETVTRLLDLGLDPFSFSDSLLIVLAQRLGRRLCPQCRETYRPAAAELDEIIEEYGASAFQATGISRASMLLPRAVGCRACLNSGYKGRVGIHELLVCSEPLKRLIKQRADTDLIRAQAIADGMTTLKQDGMLKIFLGLTDIHEVRRVCIS